MSDPKNIASAVLRYRKRTKGMTVLGRYYPGANGASPYIELRVDKIIAALRAWQLWILFLRQLAFGHVLFHEIGHHIHRTIRPEYKEKEGVANRWGARLNVNFVRKRYWYALFIIRPAIRLYRAMRQGRI
jgi:hypothetical protein